MKNETHEGMSSSSAVAINDSDEVSGYFAYPGAPRYEDDEASTITLYLTPPGVGGPLKLNEGSATGTIGYVWFELGEATDEAEIKIIWSKDGDGNPVEPKNLRFVPAHGATWEEQEDHHICHFDKPASGSPDWSWDLVIDEPGYQLSVRVKRK